jgi:serine/threonine-protein kinase
MGTAQYLSPEQARGEVVDARSDLYSTGCLLYELLTGRPPFQGDSPVSVAYQHVSEAPVPPSQVDPAVPPSLDPLVLKALAKDPDDRYQTAADFRSDVERAIAGLPITSAMAPVTVAAAGVAAADATQQIAAAGAPADPLAGVDDGEKKRSPWVWIGVAALVLLVAGLALFLGRALFGATATEQVSVPSIVSQTIQQAEATLSQQGLSLGTQTPTTSDQPKGNVLSQNPQSGSQLAKGQSVAVTVSAGRAQVQVPQLIGMESSNDAQIALNRVQLNLGNVAEKDSDQPKGAVLDQSENAGKTVDEGSSVDITVSNGLINVPDVTGKELSQARVDLTNAGFTVNTSDPAAPSAKVIAQSPARGSKAEKGTQVTLTTDPVADPAAGRANGPPAPSGQNQADAQTSASASPSSSSNPSSGATDPPPPDPPVE